MIKTLCDCILFFLFIKVHFDYIYARSKIEIKKQKNVSDNINVSRYDILLSIISDLF